MEEEEEEEGGRGRSVQFYPMCFYEYFLSDAESVCPIATTCSVQMPMSTPLIPAGREFSLTSAYTSGDGRSMNIGNRSILSLSLHEYGPIALGTRSVPASHYHSRTR